METRRSARLPKYDYGKQGVYFVTFCTYQRQCTLSTVGRDDLGAPSLRLSVIGKIVEHYIRTIPGAYPYVSIDSYVIMPNHVHMLISVLCDDGAPRSSRPTESCSYMDRNYLFSSANFFMKSMSFSTPSIGIAL